MTVEGLRALLGVPAELAGAPRARCLYLGEYT